MSSKKPFEVMSYEEFEKRSTISERYPFTCQYVYAYGFDDLMMIPWVVKDAEAAEKIYKECIEKHVTWRKLTGAEKLDYDEIQL